MNDKTIDSGEKCRILETILRSKSFQRAKRYQELLRYLVELHLAGKEVKEFTLAVEFFGKKDVFDSSVDSTVRAYVSNLRRKLELYYLTEGHDDEIQIVLPQGGYQIQFTLAEVPRTLPRQASIKLLCTILIPILLTLLILVIWLGTEKITRDRRDNRYVKKDDPIWHDLFDSDKKTLVVLGDYYFFSMPLDSGRQSYVRDVRINSEEELAAFLESHPQFKSKISKTYHTYLEEHIPWSLYCILPSLVYHNKEIELRLSSEVQLADLQRYSIIYVGPYKSLKALSTITRGLNFKYRLDEHRRLDFFDKNSNTSTTYTWVTNPETQARNDYAIVLKVSGGNNNTLLFFLSQHDFGNISTTRHFTDVAYLQELKKKIPSNYFEALFEIKGIVRADFEIKLLHVNAIDTDFHLELK
ncbi:MAG: hypothetical protein ACREOO_20550 [bacterium]